jgi:SAM-dependent methyltransferase
MLVRLPRATVVDRLAFLGGLVTGRRVIHVGFADAGCTEMQQGAGTWLHARLAATAATLVGLDLDKAGVENARAAGYEAYAVDCRDTEAVRALDLAPAEVVVAGEVIEHLDAPGPFLRAMRVLTRPDGRLVLTTPNAYRVLNFLAPVSGTELVHPDHTAWHSPRTLRTLLERNGWTVDEVAYYRNPWRRVGWGNGVRWFLVGHAANVARATLGAAGRLAPYWSDGIVVWARPS